MAEIDVREEFLERLFELFNIRGTGKATLSSRKHFFMPDDISKLNYANEYIQLKESATSSASSMRKIFIGDIIGTRHGKYTGGTYVDSDIYSVFLNLNTADIRSALMILNNEQLTDNDKKVMLLQRVKDIKATLSQEDKSILHGKYGQYYLVQGNNRVSFLLVTYLVMKEALEQDSNLTSEEKKSRLKALNDLFTIEVPVVEVPYSTRWENAIMTLDYFFDQIGGLQYAEIEEDGIRKDSFRIRGTDIIIKSENDANKIIDFMTQISACNEQNQKLGDIVKHIVFSNPKGMFSALEQFINSDDNDYNPLYGLISQKVSNRNFHVDGKEFLDNIDYIMKQAASCGWYQFNIDDSAQNLTLEIEDQSIKFSLGTWNKVITDMKSQNCNFNGMSTLLFEYISDVADLHEGIYFE